MATQRGRPALALAAAARRSPSGDTPLTAEIPYGPSAEDSSAASDVATADPGAPLSLSAQPQRRAEVVERLNQCRVRISSAANLRRVKKPSRSIELRWPGVRYTEPFRSNHPRRSAGPGAGLFGRRARMIVRRHSNGRDCSTSGNRGARVVSGGLPGPLRCGFAREGSRKAAAMDTGKNFRR